MVRLHRNQNGVTMMELMIITVIIGVLATMAAPSFFEYLPQLRTKAAVRDAISTLREARSLAISQKTDHGVFFDVVEGGYTLFANTSVPDQLTFSAEDSVVSRFNLGRDVYMNHTTLPANCVIFHPNGAASQSGTVSVNSGNYQSMYTIEISQATGFVKLHEGFWESGV